MRASARTAKRARRSRFSRMGSFSGEKCVQVTFEG
jgi:hypothetical protein